MATEQPGLDKLSPVQYAEQLYGLARCTGHAATYQDTVIIDCRVRAFIDGVRWQQNQQRKKRRHRSATGKP